jgi:DNA-directed RNA polymerase
MPDVGKLTDGGEGRRRGEGSKVAAGAKPCFSFVNSYHTEDISGSLELKGTLSTEKVATGDVMLTDANMDLQLALEEKALQEGKDRYLREQTKRELNQGFGSRKDVGKLIKGCLPILSESIAKLIETSAKKGRGKTALAIAFLQELSPDSLATLTLANAFDAIRGNKHEKRPSLTHALIVLGKAVENELWGKALENFDPKLYERLVSRAVKTHGSVSYRRKAVRSTAAKEGFMFERWTDDVRIKVAEPLLNALLQSLPEVFEVYTTYQSYDDTKKWLGITPAASEYILELIEAEAWMHPVYKPMVVPPKPWDDIRTGCYHSAALASSVPLIRTYKKDHLKLVRKAIRSGQMKPCLDALNAIQETAWAINKPVLDIVRWCWEEKKIISKFPRAEHIRRKDRPENWDALPPTKQKAWRIEAAQIAERNRAIDGERVTVLMDFLVADQMAGVERFWIPHSLDWRGRVYPVCHFNQQRSDHIKGLLQFADGKPLGEAGAYWLAVHLANCGDFEKVSKKPFDQRVQWVEDNLAMIRKIADDPRGSFELWANADKPFQYLAACLEFAGYLNQGSGFVSHLAVALDGSNSGLQHYSAALRSEEGKYVNLLPSASPADVYQEVADIVKVLVEKDAADGDERAKLVLANGIDRKLVKRNVMTFAYSSNQFGFKDQLIEDVMKPLEFAVLSGVLEQHPYSLDRANGEGDNGFRVANYLASKTWHAVNQLVKQASEGMEFFRKCAGSLAHEKKSVIWHTPIGLPVVQKYLESDNKRVKLFLYDKSVPVVDAGKEDVVVGDDVLKQIRLYVSCKPTTRIKKDKAKSAISPNVIHSLDASHLLLTVLDAVDADIRSFSLIHDSFGTHAADTEKFFHIIRSAFVNMYTEYDPFEEIHAYTMEALDDKSRCPDLPQKGSVDLSKVMESDYAFA